MNADTGVSRSPAMSKRACNAWNSSYSETTKKPITGVVRRWVAGTVKFFESRKTAGRQPTPLYGAPPPKTRTADGLVRHVGTSITVRRLGRQASALKCTLGYFDALPRYGRGAAAVGQSASTVSRSSAD